MNDTIILIATVPAIVGLVNVLKDFGVTGKWSTLSAIILGVGITAFGHYAPSDVAQWVSDGLIIGLSATGMFDMTKTKRPATVVYETEPVVLATLDDPANE